MRRFDIVDDWHLKQRDPSRSVEEDGADEQGWIPATVPGLVQEDLLSHGLIPDPYAGMNEVEVSWVGERDWLYRCRFDWNAQETQGGETALCFGGLETCSWHTGWWYGTSSYLVRMS
jgi:beta-mannosidase